MPELRVTNILADFAANTRFGDIPSQVVHESKRILLDTLSNAIAGADTRQGAVVLRYVREADGNPVATILGTGEQTSPLMAAYANGRTADALDSTDTFMTVFHLGNPATSPALALGEARRISGKDLLAAIALGYEAGARISLGEGARLPDVLRRGEKPVTWHGARLPVHHLTAAVAGAKALQLDGHATSHAIGIAGANSPPHLGTRTDEFPLEQPLHKYVDNGRPAELGASAALLAEKGLTIHDHFLDGDLGMWRRWGLRGFDFPAVVKDLGSKWYVLDNTFKPWPGCKWTQQPMTVFARLLAQHHLRPEEIERVLVRAHAMGAAPIFRNKDAREEVSLSFNYPHALAMVAFNITRGPAWNAASTVERSDIQAFRRKVDVELEESSVEAARDLVDGQIRHLPTQVIIWARGQEFRGRAESAWGDPWSEDTYFTDAQLIQKFRDMTSHRGHGARVEWDRSVDMTVEAVLHIEEQQDIRPVVRGLAERFRAAAVP